MSATHRIVIAGGGVAGLDGARRPAPPGRGRLYLQADLGPGRAGEGSVASWLPLWPAPGRVVSRWLGRYLEGVREPAAA